MIAYAHNHVIYAVVYILAFAASIAYDKWYYKDMNTTRMQDARSLVDAFLVAFIAAMGYAILSCLIVEYSTI